MHKLTIAAIVLGVMVPACTMTPPSQNGNGNANGNSNQSANTNQNANSPDTNANTAPDPNPRVTLQTPLGDIIIELFPDDAPASVDNFLQYIEDGFYDGSDGLGATVFHMVGDNFIVAGTVDEIGRTKETRDAIPNESDNGLTNDRGTVAMFWEAGPDSATSQFIINVTDNPDFNAMGGGVPGFGVFGAVVEGMDTVDEIAALPANNQDEPITPPSIFRAFVNTEP